MEQKFFVKILIVDDDPDMLRMIGQWLKKENYSVTTAENGSDCLKRLRIDRPDLILLDVMLPDTGGLEICKMIKSDPGLSSIHILFLSGVKKQPESIAEGIEAGADGYLVKPLNEREFVARIRSINKIIQTENELLRSEEKFRSLFYHSAVGKSMTTMDGKIEVNQAFCDILGYSMEELSGKNWPELTHPDDLPNDTAIMKRIINHEVESFRWEKRYIHKNGHPVYVDISSALERDGRGEPLYFITNIFDITARKIAEENLRVSEENLRITLHSIGDGVFSTDQDGIIVDLNPVAERICGWLREDAIGKPLAQVFRIINAISRKPVEDPVAKVLIDKKVIGLANHTVLVSRDGVERHIADSAAPIINKTGDITGVVLVFSDVTGNYLAQETLREKERLLRESQEVAHLGSYIWDLAKGWWTSSEILDGIFGIDNHYIRTFEGWNALVHPGWRQTLSEYVINEVLSQRQNFDKEYKIINQSSGCECWVHGLGRLELDEHDQPVKLIGTITDISTRKHAEEALVRSEHRLRIILDATPFPVALVDLKDDNILFWSQSALSLFGHTAPTTMEWYQIAYPDPDYRRDVIRRWKPALEKAKQSDGAFNTGEYQVTCNDGSVRICELFATFISEYLIVTFNDITARRQAQNELIKAKVKAEESDRLKSAFLANMSHEIRTPMNGILGFTEFLKEKDISEPEKDKYLHIIERSGNRLLNIINDIVDIAKIEAGQMETIISETNINSQTNYIFNFFEPEVKLKGLRFSLKNSLPDEQAILKTDREKLYAILTNLVKNAIRYTKAGEIEFGYSSKGNDLVFYVKDTGPGIPREHKEIIFERFMQGGQAEKQVPEGTGLGLSISKAYVKMLGGEMWVESEIGAGSVFYFTLPFHQAPGKQREKALSTDEKGKNLQGLKILIAEDDESSELLLRATLDRITDQAIFVESGEDAVEECRKNPKLDLVLMDIRMPGISGYEATRQIRQFNREVIIIAQTAYALSGEREKAIQSGCNDYVSKPLNQKILLSLIEKHFAE